MQAHSKLWYLDNFNLKKVLTLDERKRVAGKAQMQHYVKKEVLYFPAEPSDSIYILNEGKVKISRLTPNGHKIILSIIQPGEIFGELAVTGQVHREVRAEVLEDSVVCLISLEDMKGLMKDIPSLNLEISKSLGDRVKKVQSRLEAILCKSTEGRIMALIREVAQDHGRVIARDPGQVEVKLGLTVKVQDMRYTYSL